ncbi:MAG: type IV pilus assembly protein PilB [Parcubacteria group bacterium Gr01-1014_30]|nr:MAG: type IV pilus assembly protein PilB [Parcubacteria group bacterium Gr01-1014_30]
MKVDIEGLKKILVDSNLISERDFNLATKEAKEQKKSLQDLVVEKDLISDEELGQLIADQIGFPYINLSKAKVPKEILEIVPELVAREQKIIAFDRTQEGLKLAMANPENLEIREFIERKSGERVIPYFATSKDIEDVLKFYKKGIRVELEKLVGRTLKEVEQKTKTSEELQLPVIKITELILNYGYENRASDIHLEPYKNKTILRYRIDGVLHDVLTLPKFCHDLLVSRIKILAKLRTDIHEIAQDGHFSFEVPAEKVDVRVSVVPIEEGEKVVLRLLSERVRKYDLEDLGLLEEHAKIIRRNIKKPWGMTLISGPAGSGKTTTLYAVLKILNTRNVNIMTIEDPIEYDIEGVNQIQVNPKTNLTFAEGLKAIVRQNPDIIMVGEVRDIETAKLTVNAAMTGHLVLSTFHAIDSSTTLPRLSDMGTEPFLITSTVNLIISQRLVRKICPKCIESHKESFSEIAKLLGRDLTLKPKTKDETWLFKGRGCPLCQKTGYFGRTGIFETLEMQEPIKKLVMTKANADQIRKAARSLGMRTMIEDGFEKVERGITTLEEVLRAIKE